MKIAYVHVLPVEYYPPATNTLSILSRHDDWKVRAWTSRNSRGLPAWSSEGVEVRRPSHPAPGDALALRITGYGNWHIRTALQLAAWRPDAVIAVEPHSALAVWLYYAVFMGKAELFVHHHEYYSAKDYEGDGMRLLRAGRRVERDELLGRARWVSQTNHARLKLMLDRFPHIKADAARVLPNYPPQDWVDRAAGQPSEEPAGVTRFTYVGSASFEDTFIREIAEWIRARPGDASLHVVGNNVASDVWRWLESLGAANITIQRSGVPYSQLPELLARFDVGLVLYKGNTLNFVHNVPNKAIEYLASGLDVWYPVEMRGLRDFHESHPGVRLREMNFSDLPLDLAAAHRIPPSGFPFTAESALSPMIRELEMISTRRK